MVQEQQNQQNHQQLDDEISEKNSVTAVALIIGEEEEVDAAKTTTGSIISCQYCDEIFPSRNILFKHLRGNNNSIIMNNTKHSNNKKKKKLNNDRISICTKLPSFTESIESATTTTTSTPKEVCNGSSSSSSNTSSSDTNTITCNTTMDGIRNTTTLTTTSTSTPIPIPLPPSIMKKQVRQINYLQQKLLHTKYNKSSSSSTATNNSSRNTEINGIDIKLAGSTTESVNTTTSLQQQHQQQSSSVSAPPELLLWMGDIPLCWTTPNKQYQKLRLLLRTYISRINTNIINSSIATNGNGNSNTTGTCIQIPTPYIQHVCRKAYRRNSTVTTTTTTPMADVNNDNEPMIQHERQQRQQQQHDPYLGYAIVAFRHVEECNIVLQQLHNQNITIETVFDIKKESTTSSITDDIKKNKDLYQFIKHSNPKDTNFTIKVRPYIENNSDDIRINNDDNNNDNNDRMESPVSTKSTTNSQQLQQSALSSLPPKTIIPQQDPSYIDILRPLSTEVLLDRIQQLNGSNDIIQSIQSLSSTSSIYDIVQKQQQSLSSTTTSLPTATSTKKIMMNVLQEQHDRALQYAAELYQLPIHQPTRMIYHNNAGILIPETLCQKTVSILQNLRWPVIKHRNGMNTERYLVLLSNVQNDIYYNDLRVVCKEIMSHIVVDGTTTTNENVNDENFYYSGIAITKNFVASPHIDDRDQTYQYAISFGDFNVGGELCIDGGIIYNNTTNCKQNEHQTYDLTMSGYHNDQINNQNYTGTTNDKVPVFHVINTHNRLVRVDGRHVHWVRTWGREIQQQSLTSNSSGSVTSINGTTTEITKDYIQSSTSTAATSPIAPCDRYSIIFYDTSKRKPTPVMSMVNPNFSIGSK